MRYLSLPNNIHIERQDGKVLLFNPDIPSWLVTNDIGEQILSLFNGKVTEEEVINVLCELHGEMFRDKLVEFIEKSKLSGIFDRPKESEIPIKSTNYRLSAVQLSISSQCNLNCRYCYATDRIEHGQKRMAISDYKTLLDDIRSVSTDVRITLTGGEPLLNKNCFEIAKYARKNGFYVDMLTNGTLISESNINQIKEFFNEVRISVDGSTQDLHEFFRGRNSYNPMINAIDLLSRNGVNYSLSMTVNKHNIHDVEQMAKKYGGYLNFAPLFPAGNAIQGEDISITGKEYFRALKRSAGVNPLSYCESSLDHAKQCRNCKCSIGDSELSVSATGDVYPCHLLHYPDFLMGNIFEKSIVELYNESPIVDFCRSLTVDNIEGCKTCFLKYVCGGACRARAFHECRNVKTSGNFCEYEKAAYVDGIFNLYKENILSK